MDAIKIQHFKSSHPGATFPEFESLAPDATSRISREISKRLGLSDESDGLAILQELARVQKPVPNRNAEDSAFNIEETLEVVGISPEAMVYINWHRFDRVDKIRFSDLASHFDDIWYPGPDDIDIFDSSMSWVVSIAHDGYISYAKF